MQALFIKRIKLINFKGQRNYEATFTKKSTDIFGDNATGKTTLVDGFLWLLFGKDSNDRKDFDIKTLDENNNVIPEIDHEVEADIQIGQQVITIRRTLRENWVKRRGSTERELAGNDTLYHWNDVPLKAGEYQAKVAGLIDENIFKLITNPLYFNTVMKWQDRRTVLFSMAEAISDEEILTGITTDKNRAQVMLVRSILNGGKSFAEYRKELAAKKKKLKDDLEFIPARIDEANRSMPKPQDWTQVETEINGLQGMVAKLNADKEDLVKSQAQQNEGILAKQRELNDMKSKLQNMQHELGRSLLDQRRAISDQITELEYKIRTCDRDIYEAQNRVSDNARTIEQLEDRNRQLREQWNTVNNRQLEITDDKTTCPSCQRKLDDSDIEAITTDLTDRFNTAKATELTSIQNAGTSNSTKIELLKKESEDAQASIKLNEDIKAQNQKQIDNLKAQLNDLTDATPVPTDEIKALEASIQSFIIPAAEALDFTAINENISTYTNTINSLRASLNDRDQITKINTRIAELQNQQAAMTQELADLENSEFVLEAFNKAKVDTMVESVNRKFKTIKFKLFEDQINGGVAECCEALVNTNGAWVPFAAANRAGQINAGIDVINTLCEFHQVSAPIFIDNREAVIKLIDTDSQVINLIVSAAHKQLTIA